MFDRTTDWVASRRLRRRCPDLFDESLHWRRLRELTPRFAGQSVAVVGNSEAAFAEQRGGSIDAADRVARLNRGFVREPSVQGSRTDILFVATAIEPDELIREYGRVPVIFATPRRWRMSPGMLAARQSVACLPLEAWSDAAALLGGRRPSVGFLAVFGLRKLLRARHVELFGFDWKATRTFYASRLERNHHDWEAERRVMVGWAGEGWLTLPP